VFAITFSFTLFSIAGIPPLAGFFSKFFVLFSVITQEYYLTCLFIVIISSIGCFYYIRLIKTFFFTKTSKINLWISTPTRRFTEFNIAVLLFFNMFFCFYPDLLLLLSTFLTLILV
jgi:NADH:ubiquinone oxidoreductase subunit 2 (subunit N)